MSDMDEAYDDEDEDEDWVFMLQAIAPFYLITAKDRCPSCQKTIEVITFASEAVLEDEDEMEIDGFIQYQEITNLPGDLVHFLADHYPQYRLVDEGYRNHCPDCGAICREHDLNDTDGPFYPLTEGGVEGTKLITLYETGRFEMGASPIFTGTNLIAECAERKKRLIGTGIAT